MTECELDEFLRFAEANSDLRPMIDHAEIREAAGRMSPYDELKARIEK